MRVYGNDKENILSNIIAFISSYHYLNRCSNFHLDEKEEALIGIVSGIVASSTSLG